MGSKQRKNDQEVVTAIDVVEKIVKKAEREWVRLMAVVISPDLVSENFIFVTENENSEFYILVNQKDWDKAIAIYAMRNPEIDPYIMANNAIGYVPVLTDGKFAQKAVSGVYKWIYELQSPSPRRSPIYIGS